MPKPVFTQEIMDAWDMAMDEHRPADPTEFELPGFIEVVAFNPKATTAGMALRLATKGGHTIDLAINPVTARHLAHVISSMGRDAGWLDDELNVISPTFDLDS